MRTGFRYLMAHSIMVANCSSRFAPRPTLPGLMRYLASACAQSGYCVSSLWPLKWKSPTSGTRQPIASRRARMCGTCAAACGVLTVIRTSSEPARASSSTCLAVACTSSVSVLVIDCTTTGAPPPISTPSTATWRETLRMKVMASLWNGEPSDFDARVRPEVELAPVVLDAHVRGVADDDGERPAALHHALGAGAVERGHQLPAGGVGHLEPGLVGFHAHHDAMGAGGWRRRRDLNDGFLLGGRLFLLG